MWLNFDLKLAISHSALKFIRSNFFSKNKSSSYHYTMVSLLIFIKSFWSLRSYLFKSLTNKNFRDHSKYDLRYRKKSGVIDMLKAEIEGKAITSKIQKHTRSKCASDGRTKQQRHSAFFRDKRLETKQAITCPPSLQIPKWWLWHL